MKIHEITVRILAKCDIWGNETNLAHNFLFVCLGSVEGKKYDIVFVAMYLMWMHCHFSYIINKTEDSSVQQCAVQCTVHTPLHISRVG